MSQKHAILLITSGAFIIGLALISYGLIAIQKGLASKNWSVVTGEIVSSEIESIEKRSDNGLSTFHQLEVSYRYEVNGQVYLGDQLRINSPVVYLES